MRFRHGGKVATVITEALSLSLSLSPFLRRAVPLTRRRRRKKERRRGFCRFSGNTERTSDNCLEVSQHGETDGTLAATGDSFLIENIRRAMRARSLPVALQSEIFLKLFYLASRYQRNIRADLRARRKGYLRRPRKRMPDC